MNTRNRRDSSIELTTIQEEWEEVPLRDETAIPHDRFHYLDDVRRSWLLRPEPPVDRRNNIRTYKRLLCLLVTVLCLIAVPLFITKAVIPKHKSLPPLPDNYTLALHKALLFFDAQKSGKLPKNNSIRWRGSSGLEDGVKEVKRGLVGGYYDSGMNIKYHFPMSFAMSMLSWSVLEYEHKYHSTGEYDHVRDLIKWGTDYILLTFDSNASSINKIYSQVGLRGNGSAGKNDETCWERPEDIDYTRQIISNNIAPDLGGEMAAALASASIVFRDDNAYSASLLKAARTVFSFALDIKRQIPYSHTNPDTYAMYNSSGFWDEQIWGATWLYYATGDLEYLTFATDPRLANKAEAASPLPNLRVLSWDNKLPAAMILLTRVRIFFSPGYPYEEVLMRYHNAIDRTMCSYLRRFHVFNFTRGGLIELYPGDAQPLQFTAHSAFLASLYADYLQSFEVPGWFCGDAYFSRATLKKFASSQVEYILGANPMNMSYVVGYGASFPLHVHHRGASIPNDGVAYNCSSGLKWRDSLSPNPNIIIGAMVGGTDKFDRFHDVRGDYTYTEPSMAGNAGLVAALASLTSSGGATVDKNVIFSSIPNV